MTKGKRKAPSRIRYEESHPTVSCRVSREVYDRLQDIKEKERKSFTDVLMIGLGALEVKAEKEGEAYSEGYRDGYSQAERKFMVVYFCDACGEAIELDSKAEREAASEYMEEHRGGIGSVLSKNGKATGSLSV